MRLPDSVPRVLRGGGYNNTAFNCRPSYRNNNTPGNRNNNNGFRLFSCHIIDPAGVSRGGPWTLWKCQYFTECWPNPVGI